MITIDGATSDVILAPAIIVSFLLIMGGSRCLTIEL